TRGLLATDHAILNHMVKDVITPELAPPSPNYHTTPPEDVSALDRFNVHRCPTWRVSLVVLGSNLVTVLPRSDTHTTGYRDSLHSVALVLLGSSMKC
ncbi:hypothetical protein TNCV_462851, partial [Trichonephila clavipes]